MRRKDREISDINSIVEILNKCEVLRLGLSEDNRPYIVPMNFGFEFTGKITIYLHCAKAGKKLDIIAKNPSACFEAESIAEVIHSDDGCSYSMRYESVIGFGNITLVSDYAEKLHALNLLLAHYAKDKTFVFPENVVNSIAILRLDIDEVTGKGAHL